MSYQDAVQKFFKFWDDYEPNGCFWHPNDCEAACGVETANLSSRGTVKENESNKIVQNLGPIPYCGILETAKILILQLNPGFGVTSLLEMNDFRRFAGAQWKDENEQSCLNFRFIDPEFCNRSPGALQWWIPQLRSAVERVANCRNLALDEAWTRTAKVVATIDLIPYRSKNEPANWRMLMGLPSAERAIAVARAAIGCGGPTCFVHYGKGQWRRALDNLYFKKITVTSRGRGHRPTNIGKCPVFQEALLNAVQDA